MPRPGPRPYECVRRAWHSDRHQPMRGSLIQEIFRIVNETHSSATRKNKEWQDKLPIVVLKAEEIMYSKANSEAEYMDLKTLWDRANDAINTIIRLDESTETGVFLQPCIEAALNLGCIPRRTSRSQRNNTSTYYLNIKSAEPNCFPSNSFQKTTSEAPTSLSPFASPASKIMKPNSMNFSPFGLKSPIPVLANGNSLGNKFSFPPPSYDNRYFCQVTKAPSVYPLYYGNDNRPKNPEIGCDAPFNPNSDLKEHGEIGFLQRLSSCTPNNRTEANTQADFGHISQISPQIECDLSLRLGPSTVQSSNTKTKQTHKEDFGNSLNYGLKARNSETETIIEAALGKRKAVASNISDDLEFCWHPKVSSYNAYGGRLRNAGL